MTRKTGKGGGRKAPHIIDDYDKKLLELYEEGTHSAGTAAKTVGCGYDYALEFFNKQRLITLEERPESFIDRADETLIRSEKFFIEKTENTKSHITRLENKIQEALRLQGFLLPDSTKNVNKILGDAVKNLDEDAFMELLKVMKNYLQKYIDFGLLFVKLNDELRSERVFQAELQMHLDDIRLTVPPSKVLDQLMEAYIAQKQNLKPAIPVATELNSNKYFQYKDNKETKSDEED